MADAPAYWVSALAEDARADNRDAPGLTAVLKQHAKYHAISERDLTMMVAKEWERQGVARLPMSGILRGWL